MKTDSFEHLLPDVKLKDHNHNIKCVYRSSHSKAGSKFLAEFQEVAMEMLVKPVNLLTVGDFNIHIDNEEDQFVKKFQGPLKFLNLQQLAN